ncbi:ABC transporter permease [Rhizobium sp. NPDC090279]|uniref:ABC transporter permease n=1 Tax=Rhizobium sp. NPDC090279 TaxID=3364499 RepID=UPI00383A1F7A
MSKWWRGWAVPLALLAAAEMAMHGVQSYALASPSEALKAFVTLASDGQLWRPTAETLGAALSGVILGGGLGLVLGLWFGLVRSAAFAGSLSVELLRPIPSVALIPVVLLIFGFGWRMEVSVVAFSCVWPMLIYGQAAVSQVEPRLIEVGQVLGLSPIRRVLKLVIPAVVPRLFVAFRLSVGVALIVAVTVEVAANPQGLGYGMILAQQTFRPADMFALLGWTGLLGWGLSTGLHSLEKRLFAHYGAIR